MVGNPDAALKGAGAASTIESYEPFITEPAAKHALGDSAAGYGCGRAWARQ